MLKSFTIREFEVSVNMSQEIKLDSKLIIKKKIYFTFESYTNNKVNYHIQYSYHICLGTTKIYILICPPNLNLT